MIQTKNPFETVSLISGSKELNVDTHQSNRYCILVNSEKGKEAYYFSTPIYHEHSCRLVRPQFVVSNDGFHFVGSNCEVRVTSTNLKLQRGTQSCVLQFERPQAWEFRGKELISDQLSIVPTYNGVCIEGDILQRAFEVTADFGYQSLRTNQSCVCFMESRFKPIMVMSALFATRQGTGCQPLQLSYRKTSVSNGALSFAADNRYCTHAAFEISFYEPKLIQDTPVSGNYPRENNAFGPIAFVGKSNYYGTQWLYSRLDIGKMPELNGKRIQKIKLYIHRFTSKATELNAFALSNRFCSFGSTWINKIEKEERHDSLKVDQDYLCLDLTQRYVNRGLLSESAGVVIAPARSTDDVGYQAISTGDSYLAPPVLCVKYANY